MGSQSAVSVEDSSFVNLEGLTLAATGANVVEVQGSHSVTVSGATVKGGFAGLA